MSGVNGMSGRYAGERAQGEALDPKLLKARAADAPIKTIALLICTRDRLPLLADCLSSLVNLDVPEGVQTVICVADNNGVAQETAIRDMAREAGLEIAYGHQGKRGYASARNCALQLAIDADADLAIFFDDDSLADPGLAVEHLRAINRYRADAILGRIEGMSQQPREGRRVTKAGTGNVSVRRWLFDPAPEGLALRFDERLDLLGQEDWEFFKDVVRHGGEIRQSCLPVVHDAPSPTLAVSLAMRSFEEKCIYAAMEGRNDVVVARMRHGFGAALSRLVRRQAPQLTSGIGELGRALVLLLVDRAASRSNYESALVRFAKIRAAFSGLWRPGFERQAARLGKLVEVVGLN
ncbi:MAG: glycosyltransferase family 2 protein [Alphaproteobacteria bacterium]|nr:glycosyltransferase family 2 protein [Alphaproteobacteria bacterium]